MSSEDGGEATKKHNVQMVSEIKVLQNHAKGTKHQVSVVQCPMVTTAEIKLARVLAKHNFTIRLPNCLVHVI